MRVCSLSSGSRGNCIYVDTDNTKLLVDVGISFRSLKERASALGIDLGKIDGIVITHEHSDHIAGVARTAKVLNVPVYCHPKCRDTLLGSGLVNYYGDIDEYEGGFDIKGAKIAPFRTPHDAKFSCGYNISENGKSVAIATDLGVVTNGVYSNMVGSDVVFLESNHDIEMLLHCCYPQPLIKRILSNNGHLSNLACSQTIRRFFQDGTSKFILGHVSQESNLEKLVYQETDTALKELRAENYTLEVATQNAPSKIIEV